MTNLRWLRAAWVQYFLRAGFKPQATAGELLRVTVALLLDLEFRPAAHLAPYEHPGSEVAVEGFGEFYSEYGPGYAWEFLCVTGWRYYTYQDSSL